MSPHKSYALVSVEPRTGTLRRYECGGNGPRLTHDATCDEACSFSADVVENFRKSPGDKFAVGFGSPDAMVFA